MEVLQMTQEISILVHGDYILAQIKASEMVQIEQQLTNFFETSRFKDFTIKPKDAAVCGYQLGRAQGVHLERQKKAAAACPCSQDEILSSIEDNTQKLREILRTAKGFDTPEVSLLQRKKDELIKWVNSFDFNNPKDCEALDMVSSLATVLFNEVQKLEMKRDETRGGGAAE